MSIGGRWAMGCGCCARSCPCTRFLWMDTFCPKKLQYMRLRVAGLAGQCLDLEPCECASYGDPDNDSFLLRRVDDRTFRRVHRRGGIDVVVELSATYAEDPWPWSEFGRACAETMGYGYVGSGGIWTPADSPTCTRRIDRVLVTGPHGRRVEITWDLAGNRQFVKSSCGRPCDIALTPLPFHTIRLFPDACYTAGTVSVTIGGLMAGAATCCTAINGTYVLTLTRHIVRDCNTIPQRYELTVDKGSGCVVTVSLSLSFPGGNNFCDDAPDGPGSAPTASVAATVEGSGAAVAWDGGFCTGMSDPQSELTLSDWGTPTGFGACGGTPTVSVGAF